MGTRDTSQQVTINSRKGGDKKGRVRKEDVKEYIKKQSSFYFILRWESILI
jgi:hypothetical protein